MHCTGQTSTHARSLTPMQASVMIATPATSRAFLRDLWPLQPSAFDRACSSSWCVNRDRGLEQRGEAIGPSSATLHRFDDAPPSVRTRQHVSYACSGGQRTLAVLLLALVGSFVLERLARFLAGGPLW